MMKTNSTFEKIPEEETQRDSESHQDIHQEGLEPQVGTVFPGPVKAEPTIIEELALQQHMLQIKQQQYLQQQILEDQYQKNRQILQGQHEKQLQVFLQQMETQRKQKEVAMERKEQLRIETLRQKDEMCQSAVASPEVKRRLQEVILQRKRKEAAASMGNLRTGIPVSSAQVNPNSMLRKVQSESNLLKIKSKRPGHSSGPYPRVLNSHLRLVPEASVVSSEDSTPSPISVTSLSLPTAPSRKPADSSSGSAPSSPSTAVTPCRPAPLGHSIINSRSLPNIPSSLDPARQSPPGPVMRPPPHHRVVPVRRTQSSAILPLRKHLMEKSMAERKSMDDNQYYYQQTRLERERLNRASIIRPLEEVMEEDTGTNNHIKSVEDMDVDEARKMSFTSNSSKENSSLKKSTYFTARLGSSGISPLVLGDGYNEPSGAKTGLAYNSIMLKHECVCQNTQIHPENPERIQYIWSRLTDTGLIRDCQQVSRLSSLEEIQCCHTEAHTLMFGTDVINRKSLVGQDLNRDGTLSKFTVLPCGGLGVDSDTYWNEIHTSTAARYAVGSVVELTQRIASGELKNGFGVVRPPGHHAEQEEAMGFCYFNTVAVAAHQLLLQTPVNKILIVDWAIHHGNSTQKFFYEDNRVLYISIHRHDNGNFYPGTGGSIECGAGPGLGTNINIAWSGGLDPPMGDAEYLAAFRSIVIPVARSFCPDFVLVSAGFDAAAGHDHPIGGYRVSTACFAFLTRQLLSLACGRVALVLEGGYNLSVLCDCVEQCVRALLGHSIEKIGQEELARRPCQNAIDTLQKTMAIQSQYWPVLARYADTVLLSHFESWEKEKEETEALSAMASLSMQQHQPRVIT